MQLSHPQPLALLTVPKEEGHSVETPVKKSKGGFHSHLKTAETPTLSLSATKRTIADVDAEELFENFSRLVTVSETKEQFEDVELLRKLDYGQEQGRLNFEESTSSMRKKRRGSRLLPGQEGECIKVKPFVLT